MLLSARTLPRFSTRSSMGDQLALSRIEALAILAMSDMFKGAGSLRVRVRESVESPYRQFARTRIDLDSARTLGC